MADIKISELGAASAVNATDLFPMTSSGVTVKATAQQIKNYIGVGNLSDLDTTDKSSAVAAINEVNTKVSKTEVLTTNIQQSIAPIQTTLVASKAYTVGEQFVYNGLLYKATMAIAQGGTITINGNCTLADSVTEQIKSVNDILTQQFTSVSSGYYGGYIKIGKIVIVNTSAIVTQNYTLASILFTNMPIPRIDKTQLNGIDINSDTQMHFRIRNTGDFEAMSTISNARATISGVYIAES